MPFIPKTPNPVVLATTPAYPVPKRTFRVTPTPQANSTGTHVRIWCAGAPPGTELRKKLDESRASKVIFQPLTKLTSTAHPISFDVTLEKGGGYWLQIDEILVGNGFSGGYEDDPRGAPGEVIKSSRFATLFVASPLTMQLGCGQDTATLRLFVHDETVIQTEFAVHGETTPRIEISPSATSRARMAAEDVNVLAILATLAGSTAEDLIGDLGELLDGLLTKATAHMGQSVHHYSDDEANTVGASFFGASTAQSRAVTLNELRRMLGRHMRNDDGTGTGAATWHAQADWTSLPLDAATPSDALMDGVSHADVWRAYEAHRMSGVHRNADNTNRADVLPPLLNLHQYFLASLAAAGGTAPVTSQTATALLVSQLGFKEP